MNYSKAAYACVLYKKVEVDHYRNSLLYSIHHTNSLMLDKKLQAGVCDQYIIQIAVAVTLNGTLIIALLFLLGCIFSSGSC